MSQSCLQMPDGRMDKWTWDGRLHDFISLDRQ